MKCSSCGRELQGGLDTFGWNPILCQDCFLSGQQTSASPKHLSTNLADQQANPALPRSLQRLLDGRLLRPDNLQSISPHDFEQLVGWLFSQAGYSVKVTAQVGDSGVDLLVTKATKRAVVQCKRYSGAVGAPVVRELYGAMHHENAAKAYLVTCGTFTKQAVAWAKGKSISLIAGEELVLLLQRDRPII